MRIISLDPGGRTGWVYHELPKELRKAGDKIKFTGGELGPHRHHEELWNLLISLDPQIIVCERFVYQIRKLTDKDGKEIDMPGVDLTAREYIGIAQLYCDLHGIPLEQQTVAQAKLLWPDKQLKKLGLHTTNGEGHQNDATRHLMFYLSSTIKRWDYVIDLKKKAPDSSQAQSS